MRRFIGFATTTIYPYYRIKYCSGYTHSNIQQKILPPSMLSRQAARPALDETTTQSPSLPLQTTNRLHRIG